MSRYRPRFDRFGYASLECPNDERAFFESLPARTGRLHSGVVHASGGALHGRVSGTARQTLHSRDVQDAGTRGAGHPRCPRGISAWSRSTTRSPTRASVAPRGRPRGRRRSRALHPSHRRAGRSLKQGRRRRRGRRRARPRWPRAASRRVGSCRAHRSNERQR